MVKDHKNKVPLIIQFIVSNLDYDKIYYYGNNSPLHVSVNSELFDSFIGSINPSF